MNNPEYILTDELETIVTVVKIGLSLSALNYQYGTVEELNETLQQLENDRDMYEGKFPLVWLPEPYTTDRGIVGIYGEANTDLFIINATEKTWKAPDRMTNNYKTVILPVYRRLLAEIVLSPVFDNNSVDTLKHSVTKGYYWDEQKKIFNDAVDCLKISGLKLRINDKQDCTPTKSF